MERAFLPSLIPFTFAAGIRWTRPIEIIRTSLSLRLLTLRRACISACRRKKVSMLQILFDNCLPIKHERPKNAGKCSRMALRLAKLWFLFSQTPPVDGEGLQNASNATQLTAGYAACTPSTLSSIVQAFARWTPSSKRATRCCVRQVARPVLELHHSIVLARCFRWGTCFGL